LGSICGIQAESYPVIIENIVAPADRRADPGGLGIEAVKGEVQVAIVVGDTNISTKGGFLALERIV